MFGTRSVEDTKFKVLIPKEPGKEWPKVNFHTLFQSLLLCLLRKEKKVSSLCEEKISHSQNRFDFDRY
jgi:hypothetical protein